MEDIVIFKLVITDSSLDQRDYFSRKIEFLQKILKMEYKIQVTQQALWKKTGQTNREIMERIFKYAGEQYSWTVHFLVPDDDEDDGFREISSEEAKELSAG